MRPIYRPAIRLLALSVLILLISEPAWAHGILVGSSGTGAPLPTRRSPVRLSGHTVRATIEDRTAEVTVEQVFRNTTGAVLEGTYLFPLPEGAVVSRFAMTMGGQMVEGEVLEAAHAKRVYEHIVRRRRDPGLLEYVGRGVYRARVFPIPARGDVTIRLTFQQMLPESDGTLEFRYPLATARFHGAPVDRTLIDVQVQSSVDLKALYSGSHNVAIERDRERAARVTYESAGRRQERDFTLFLGRSPDEVGFSIQSHRAPGQDGTFLAVFAPRSEVSVDERVPKDVVYALDVSGSMAGEKIEQAKGALQYGIQVLNPGDRFNVVTFATGLQPYLDGFVDATPESKKAAVAWIEGLEARGGTNIEGALAKALSMKTEDRLFLVVFLTDGKPTVGQRSADALVEQVKARNTAQARVFTFGVGHDLDVKLLDRIAEATKGTRDYVPPGEDIEVTTSRFFRKVNQPVLSHLEVDLGGGVHDVYPQELGDLFAGDQIVLFGRYDQPGPRTITLKGRVGNRDVVHTYDATFRAGEGASFLPRLWANRKVAFLLDQIRLHGADDELKSEVVRLATRHAIVTPYTAALVIEEHAMVGEPVVRDGEIADHVETDNDLPFEESIGGNLGLSDAPFTGPANNGLIGLGGGSGGAFRGRGGHRTLRATADALAWLAAHQSADGRWSSDGFGRVCDQKPWPGEGPDGAGAAGRDVGATAWALTSFLGSGYTNRGRHAFARTVSRGLRYLRNQQDAEGCFGVRSTPHVLADHAVATLAMVEAYGMTESPIFVGSADKALEFLLAARNADGGWGSGVATGMSDVYHTGLAALAIHSAALIDQDAVRRGRPARLSVDTAVLRHAASFVLSKTDAKTGMVNGHARDTAIGMVIRLFAGEDPRTSGALQRGARVVLEACTPVWDTSSGTIDLVAWYFGTLALQRVGGQAWKHWSEALQTVLKEGQRKDTDRCLYLGSRDPLGPGLEAGGRVQATALMHLDANVFYRYDRVFGTHSVGQTAPAAPTVAQETHASETLRDLKGGVAGRGTGPDGLDGVRARIRTAGDKTFTRRHDGCWIDTSWDGEGEPETLVTYSDAYFQLLQQGEGVARILAVGEHVLFRTGGRLIEVVPAPEAPNQD